MLGDAVLGARCSVLVLAELAPLAVLPTGAGCAPSGPTQGPPPPVTPRDTGPEEGSLTGGRWTSGCWLLLLAEDTPVDGAVGAFVTIAVTADEGPELGDIALWTVIALGDGDGNPLGTATWIGHGTHADGLVIADLAVGPVPAPEWARAAHLVVFDAHDPSTEISPSIQVDDGGGGFAVVITGCALYPVSPE